MKAELLLLSALLLVAHDGGAAPSAPRARRAQLTGVDNGTTLDVNDLRMFVTNTGSFAWDKSRIDVGGLEFPKGSGRTCVFAAGPWLAATVGGQIRVAVSEYTDEYRPGAMIGAAPDDSGLAEYHVYKLDRRYTSSARRDSALASYIAGAVLHGAPPVALLPDGTLDIRGDQMLWAVYNDADPGVHTNRAGSTAPLGVEIQQTTYAWMVPGPLSQTAFLHYRIINKGGNRLDGLCVGLWSDPDVGYASDDLVGCDTTRSLGFAYNGSDFDAVYGHAVPAVGFDFLRGPRVGAQVLGMTAFVKYIGGTDPDNGYKTFFLLHGLQSNGFPIVNPVTGEITTFVVSGDPVRGTGWLDQIPSDRRLTLSSGPFTMMPGDTAEVMAAVVIGQGSNRLASIDVMKLSDDHVQSFFDHGERMMVPPPAPRVVATPGDRSVALSWGAGAEMPAPDQYPFQGYIVRQLRGPEGPASYLATFDIPDGIKAVYDLHPDPETGYVVPYVAAAGSDAGLWYTYATGRDTIRHAPLVNAQRYWFSVASYGVDTTAFPRVLESPPTMVEVVPQPPGGGVSLATTRLSPAVQGQRSPGPFPTTDQVTIEVVDSLRVMDAVYQVGFEPSCASCAEMAWYVVRAGGAPDTVMSGRTDFSGGDQNPVFDGLRVRVASAESAPGDLARVDYQPASGNPVALAGVARGLRFLGGGADYAANDLGGTIPSSFPSTRVEIRFTGGPPGQKAYRYLRTLDNTNTRVYKVQDYVDAPFTIWDITHNRQLTACFLEDAGPPPSPTMDGTWDPDASDDGGREFVWVDTTGYTAAPDPARMPGGDPTLSDLLLGKLPLLYELASRLVSPSSAIAAGDKILFASGVPASPNDFFTFTATAATRSDVVLARDQLNRVLAVPNPYNQLSSYERGNERIVKFTHLPVRCTLRIFTLAGELVKTLDKDDDSSQLTWDLTNRDGRLVASGVYLFHVEAPGVGSHVGKLAVFMR